MCVQVCPTGIDIRKGLQYECIACAACIDACDEVMDKVGYPRGLIRYDTQHGLEGKPKHVLRPRTIVYATLIAAADRRLRLHDHRIATSSPSTSSATATRCSANCRAA